MRQQKAVLVLFAALEVSVGSRHSGAKNWAEKQTAAQQEGPKTNRAKTVKQAGSSTKVANVALVKSYGKIPLRFEANQGQADARVKFVSHGLGYRLLLTETEAILALRGGLRNDPFSSSGLHDSAFTTVTMSLTGANEKSAVVGVEELSGRTNYILGNDPQKWRTNVPAYGGVKYEEVYSGIDLVYHGNSSRLEYDFVVRPGADPRRIGIQIKVGAGNGISEDEQKTRRIRVDGSGDLIVAMDAGELVLHKPVAYQLTSDAKTTKTEVAARYVLENSDGIGFEVGKYDPSKELIIDPILSYSTYLGGSRDDLGNAIAVDSQGNVYVTGGTTSANFPVTSGVAQATYGGADGGYQSVDGDIFVTKLSADGASLVWSTYLGGSGDDNAYSIAVDETGVYLTGGTNSSDYPVTSGAYRPTSNTGLTDVFVTKLDPTGSSMLYSTHIGVAVEGIRGFGIAVDGAGSAYVAGGAGPGFPTTAGAFQTSSNAFSSAFVMKLNPSGSAADYCTFLSGLNFGDVDYAEGIAIDKNGDAYVTGWAGSSTFPLTAGAFQNHNAGTHDAFLTVLNATGTALLYSTYLGGSGDDEGFRVAVDGAGMAYIAGVTASTDLPTTSNAFQTVYGGGPHDAFIAKLDPTKSGSASLVYSTYLGGSGDDNSIAFPWGEFAVDSLGNAHITGGTTSTDFPTVHALQATSGGGYDAFVAKLNPNGSSLIYSTYFGGSGDDIGRGLAVDGSGNVYVTGQTSSSDFEVTQNAYQKTFGGASDAFIAKLVPIAFVTPTSLTFTNQAVGSTSQAQTFTLMNEQNTTLNLAITTSGDFAETDTCGSSLGPGLSCTVSATFSPTFPLARTGTVTITDNAANSPQTVMLSGVGVGPAVSFGQNSFSVGSQLVTTSGSTQVVILTNAGNAPLTVSSIGVSGTNSGEFAQTNSCSGSNATLAANGTCTISLIFTPAAAGSRTASLTVTDNAPANPQSLALTGTGTDFSIAAASGANCPSGGNCSATATIKTGQSATYNLQVTPSNGFTGTVALSCAGAPGAATCSVSPVSASVSGASGSAFAVSVANTSSVSLFPFVQTAGSPKLPLTLIAFVALVLGWMLIAGHSVGRKRLIGLRVAAVTALAVIIVALLQVSCGGGSAAPTNVTLTITGTSSAVTRSLPLNLTVNH